MGGFGLDKSKKTSGGPIPARPLGDGCDLSFRTDLVGVRSEVSEKLMQGERLEVLLITKAATNAAVCRTAGGDVVGTLAAFRGLARLIACLESGATYVAHVEAASPSRCSVEVLRR